ncbi:MAG TPA: Gfo/Idh/MocA family oxidoreductase [Gemmataceae bacterium]|nr:Gfo/Idh/MocA family oxidoreductase [Gemmataceae bacterium]
MAPKCRVAVIGRTGKGNYGHGLDVVWKAFDNVEVVAVADPDDKGRAAAAKRLGAKNAYADYRQMLDKERPQLVSVADRWLDQHRDMVVACARAGAHVFLEKPLCRTLAEADEMVRECEMRHVKLAIAHQTRYSPRLRRVRELIAAGRLGEVLELRGRGKEDSRGGGNDLMVLGTHIMDLMRFLAGDARWCHARILQNGRPATKADVAEGGEGLGPVLGDWINATYGFGKGVEGTFGTAKGRGSKGSRFGLTVLGTKGVLQLTTGSLPAAYFLEDPTWFPGRSKAQWQEVTSAGVGKPEPLKDGGLGMGNVWIARDLMEAVEKDRQPLGSIYDGRAALEMILAVYESHRLKGTAELPLKNRQHPLTML